MIVQVLQVTGARSRSVVMAQVIDEIYVDEMPDDQIAFAEEHGGDFIEVLGDYDFRK
jgi:hypothetical protein